MLQFRQAHSAVDMQAIYRLRYEVYCLERHYLDAKDYPEMQEQDEYDVHSVHIIAVDTDAPEKALGCLRLIRNNPFGFPCEQHFNMRKRAPIPDCTIEWSRLIISPDSRRIWRYLFMGIVKEYYLYGREVGLQTCYAILEKPMFHQMCRLGLLLEIVGEGEWHMGGLTFPIYMDFTAYDRAIRETPQGTWYYDYLRSPRGDERAVQHMLARAHQLTAVPA
jgi:N-acyl-L-homoserine lactone synthetase